MLISTDKEVTFCLANVNISADVAVIFVNSILSQMVLEDLRLMKRLSNIFLIQLSIKKIGNEFFCEIVLIKYRFFKGIYNKTMKY